MAVAPRLFTKIRPAIIALAAATALSTAALPGAASAVTRQGSSPTPVASARVSMELTAGGAGVPGYDDATCQSLASDYNIAEGNFENALRNGDEEGVAFWGELANRIYGQVTDNCFVIFHA